MQFTINDGTAVRLGAVLASAGEGTIHDVSGRPDVVAKIFHRDLKELDVKLAKVRSMIASPPDGAVQSDGFVVLTWPTELISDTTGAAGYLMPRVDTSDAVEIHTVSNPSNRANPLPTAPVWTPNVTWSHLVNVAANLCLAVDIVHRVNAVIGDFQERNILVNDTTRVTLVDCDSMQFIDEDGRQYRCGVARPEFTAPELSGVDLAATAREKSSDLFALAVHIHLLLMSGNHPFLRGEWVGAGEQPDALTLAASGQWAGGPGSSLYTHPLAPPPSFLPQNIQQLFVRVFTTGAQHPSERPTASEWRDALLSMQLGTCPRGHQIPAESDPCPWCAIDDQRAARRSSRATTSADQVVYRVADTARQQATPAYSQPAPSASTSRSSPAAAVAPQSTAGIGTNRNLVIALGVAAVLVVGLLLALVIPSGDESSRTVSSQTSLDNERSTYPTYSTTTAAPVMPARAAAAPPPSAKPCGGPVAGTYSRAAAGTDSTSCPFAIAVRDAVNATGQQMPSSVNAFSPVTDKWYAMTCGMELVVTCRGGKNAVVYVY